MVNGKAVLLTSDGETTTSTDLPSLSSSHDETDRRVVQYVMYGEEQGYENVTVRTPDGDLFFNLAYYCSKLTKLKQLTYDVGVGLNRRQIDILRLARKLGEKRCTALLGIYIYTGEDCNASFKGKGKVQALKILEKSPEYEDTFAKLGEEWMVSADVVRSLEKFTCALYRQPRFHLINKARLNKLKTMCGNKSKLSLKSKINFHNLPPGKNSLVPHIRRVNYQARRIKLSHEMFPEIPEADQGHGWIKVGNVLEPLWTDGPILPDKLVDLLPEHNSDELDWDSDEEDESNSDHGSEDESGADSDWSGC